MTENPYQSPHANTEPPLSVDMTFRGLQAFGLKLDRFYKFYITPEAIYAGWIGGQLYDKTSARFQLFGLYFTVVGIVLVEPIAAWVDSRRQRLERHYDVAISDRAEFLASDQRNLEITRASITSIAASPRKTHRNGWTNSGFLTFQCRGQRDLKVTLHSSRSLEEVVGDLLAAGYPVETR